MNYKIDARPFPTTPLELKQFIQNYALALCKTARDVLMEDA